MSQRLAILGCGNMGRAILGGILRAGLVPADQVRITSLNTADAHAMAAELGVQVASSNAEAVQQADIVLLAVKPQQYADLAAEIRPQLQPQALPEATLRPVLDVNDPAAIAQWLLDNGHRFHYDPALHPAD